MCAHFIVDGRMKSDLGVNADVLPRPVRSLDHEREVHAIAEFQRPYESTQHDAIFVRRERDNGSGRKRQPCHLACRLPGPRIATTAATSLTTPISVAPSVLVRFINASVV